MKHWLEDRHFRSLLKNSSYLAMSRAVAAVGALATLAFAGRGLGVVLFGLLVLIHSYVQAVSGLTKFNSWQVIVRYGGPALASSDLQTFRRAVGFSLGLDLASGLVAMAGAMALIPLLAPWFGLPREMLGYTLIYCLLVPMMGASVPTGVLRALDRFDLLSWQGTIQPNLRAVLALIAWTQGWGFAAYLAIWFVTDLVADAVLWTMAWRELRRRGLLAGIGPRLNAQGLDRGWQFALSINLNGSLVTAWGPLSRLLVGTLLSPAAAGLYRIASSIADVAQRPADMLTKAFYPEVMRLEKGGRKPWRLMIRATLVAAAMGLVMCTLIALSGEWLLKVAFGPPFIPAYSVLLVLLGVPLIGMISFPLPAMLHAIERTHVPIVANLVGLIAYVTALFPLVARFDLIGAGAAFVFGLATMAAVMAVVLIGEHRKLGPRR